MEGGSVFSQQGQEFVCPYPDQAAVRHGSGKEEPGPGAAKLTPMPSCGLSIHNSLYGVRMRTGHIDMTRLHDVNKTCRSARSLGASEKAFDYHPAANNAGVQPQIPVLRLEGPETR